jgi:hypothetical protein
MAAGTAVTTLSLRDLPATTVEFEGLLGGRLGDVLGSTAIDRGRQPTFLAPTGVRSPSDGFARCYSSIRPNRAATITAWSLECTPSFSIR